jgi:hypothetical protein
MPAKGHAHVTEHTPDPVPKPRPAAAPPGRRPPTSVGAGDADNDAPRPPAEPYALRVLGKLKRRADESALITPKKGRRGSNL